MLFGIVTIPFWGYRTTPIALLDVMIADLPHVMYHYKDKFTKDEIDNRITVQNKINETIKEKGITAVKGLNLNFKSVANGNDIINAAKSHKY